MSPNIWGPPTWTLLHCLAAKIKEDKFREISPQLFLIIKNICANLPCPDCAMHATQFFARVNLSHIKTKTDFKQLIYVFHNMVNKRKNKPMYNINNLNLYNNVNLVSAFNNFISVYHTRGNMKMLAESFQRNIILKQVKKWFMLNYSNFDP